jgi:hypothetical protein
MGSMQNYAEFIEWVPVEYLDKIKEFDRTKQPLLSREEYEKLKADIKVNGIKEPLMIYYYQQENTVILAEGNHRLAIAKELGMKSLPCRVIRNEKSYDFAKEYTKVSGAVPNKHGYVSGDLKPSDIGIPTAKQEEYMKKLLEKFNKIGITESLEDYGLRLNDIVSIKNVTEYGETGKIVDYNDELQQVTVEFDKGQRVEVDIEEIEPIENQ